MNEIPNMSRKVVKQFSFCGAFITIYYVTWSGGAECFEYGIDLWNGATKPVLVTCTDEEFGTDTGAEIEACIHVMSHMVVAD